MGNEGKRRKEVKMISLFFSVFKPLRNFSNEWMKGVNVRGTKHSSTVVTDFRMGSLREENGPDDPNL